MPEVNKSIAEAKAQNNEFLLKLEEGIFDSFPYNSELRTVNQHGEEIEFKFSEIAVGTSFKEKLKDIWYLKRNNTTGEYFYGNVLFIREFQPDTLVFI